MKNFWLDNVFWMPSFFSHNFLWKGNLCMLLLHPLWLPLDFLTFLPCNFLSLKNLFNQSFFHTHEENLKCQERKKRERGTDVCSKITFHTITDIWDCFNREWRDDVGVGKWYKSFLFLLSLFYQCRWWSKLFLCFTE